MAIYRALANNYVSQLCSNREIEGPVYFQGGVAKLFGMKRAFEEIWDKEIYIPDNCEFMGAIGAGFLLIDYCFDKNMIDEDEIIQCKKCANRCLVNAVRDGDVYIYSGGLCGNSFRENIVGIELRK